MNKIQQFIVDNDLDLDDLGSGLNGVCLAIAGYACYLEYDNIDDLLEDIWKDEFNDGTTSEFDSELERVFDYAYENGYEDWWSKPEAKKIYKF